MLSMLQTRLEQIKFTHPNVKFVLAVSGGRDSMALADMFDRLKIPFSVAHVNYGIRPESLEETKLINHWCRKRKIPFSIQFCESKPEKGNFQSWAREVRYRFFTKCLSAYQSSLLVLAHHAVDQMETFFLQALRGSSSKGLSGMKVLDGNKFRPLLKVTREEINQYVAEYEVPFLEDKSNESLDYSRNFIRHEIVEKLKRNWPSNVSKSLLQTIGNQHEIEEYLSLQLNTYLSNSLIRKKDYLLLDNWKDVPAILLKKWLLEKGFFKDDLGRILDPSTKDRAIFVGSRESLQLYGSCLLVTSNNDAHPDQVLDRGELSNIFDVTFGSGSPPPYPNGHHSVIFDADKLLFPLIYRHWKSGDVIQPLGLKGQSSKVSDVLNDGKIPSLLKPKIRVLCDSEDRILWVPGMKRSLHAKLDDSTLNWVRIEVKSE